jgi:hypothetical protein
MIFASLSVATEPSTMDGSEKGPGMTVFTGTRNGRVLHLDDPRVTGRRDLVVALREADAYPLPLPNWEADDESGLVMLCRDGDVPLASARLVVRRRDDGREWFYMPAEMVGALPSGVERIVFCERLVVARSARSLDLLALLLYATATAGLERLGVRNFVAVVQPATERLIAWFGGHRLTDPLELRGLGITGVLMAGDMIETVDHSAAMLAARGWTVTRHDEPGAGIVIGQGADASPAAGANAGVRTSKGLDLDLDFDLEVLSPIR